MRTFVFLCVTTMFGFASNTDNVLKKGSIVQQKQQITGTVKDSNGQPLPGVNIIEKGTNNGVLSDFDGNYAISSSNGNATLAFSFMGYKTKEVAVNNQTTINVTLEEDVSALNEVVVVGYGTQKKTTMTSSVSKVTGVIFEDRPVANVTQGLQGAVAGLSITNSSSGGEPGAEQNINIRGLMTSNDTGSGINNASPLVIVDGAVMDINDINPDDIDNITVLKDAASASIYGSRAAGGAILITTKTGKGMNGGMKVTYSNNFSWSQPTQWPDQANALDYANVMNEALYNHNKRAWFTEQEMEWIGQNMANPGSAPTLVPKNNDTTWDVSSGGLGASGSTVWKDFLFNDNSEKSINNLSIRGGDEKLNYYMSAGFLSENGLFAVAKNDYDRFNIDAKISAKPYKWLRLELLTKYVKSDAEYPWDPRYGRGRVFDQLSKLKPTMPTVDPYWGEPLPQAYYPAWQYSNQITETSQLSILPRIVIEPIKDLFIHLEYNYRTNNNRNTYTALEQTWTQPNGVTGNITSREQTRVAPTLSTNEYSSPNLYVNYTKSINEAHNIDATAGYQSELYEVYNLSANAYGLLSDNVVSISTAVGDQTVTDVISHQSNQSLFARVGYNYKEKYIARVTYRRDGSSKFEKDDRWTGFPSIELGYNIAKENFWPVEKISMFKLRATKGSLGNQNVANYLYVPTIPVANGFYLFNGEREYTAQAPNLTSINLTWETVNTSDIGIDILAFGNKLGFSFDWYRSDIENMATAGTSLPAVLGTSSPLINGGTSRTQGWDSEISWTQTLGDFRYNIRATLTDYKQTIVEFDNASNLISDFFPGKTIGDIWGLEWEGWFQSTEEATERNEIINQRWVHNSTFGEGDAKYTDINGDGVINRGTNTVGDTGDFSVIGNTTPRYQYGIRLGADYKGFDFMMFIQGVGKRDIAFNNSKQFLGPSQGPFHSNVYSEHIDYYRSADSTSPFGPNQDAYFAKPYSQNGGKNNRNYKYNTDHFLQSGAYTRLKSISLGYSIPKNVLETIKIDRIRVYVTGENLLTISDLMFYDPEGVNGTFSGGASYPLSKTISTGINVSF